MADDAGMRLFGLVETINNLKQLEEKLRNNILRRASRAAGQIYLKAVKSQAYGPGRTRRTGLLGRSPGVTVSKRADLILGRVRMRPVNVGGKTKFAKGVRKARRIDADAARRYAAFYWKFLERGVLKQRKTKSGASRGILTPRSWVRPIFNADSGPALDAYRTTVEKALTEEALKLPKTYRR